ncbi:Histone-lysine N-methyltransferase ATXR2 [Dendrobium catenatum]|uniref:Histone-lysine N-methyltransferase ATXR2 n=1 Tax=Dendrobium catenatum TaxID=906689 RepID=A0A2I0W3E9_9ASPA|nr:Histone-lysine N-methyltransferase ATXR2 [Dendrobium catenatum]
MRLQFSGGLCVGVTEDILNVLRKYSKFRYYFCILLMDLGFWHSQAFGLFQFLVNKVGYSIGTHYPGYWLMDPSSVLITVDLSVKEQIAVDVEATPLLGDNTIAMESAEVSGGVSVSAIDLGGGSFVLIFAFMDNLESFCIALICVSFLSTMLVISFTILRYRRLKQSLFENSKRPSSHNSTNDCNLSFLLEAWKPIAMGFKRRRRRKNKMEGKKRKRRMEEENKNGGKWKRKKKEVERRGAGPMGVLPLFTLCISIGVVVLSSAARVI